MKYIVSVILTLCFLSSLQADIEKRAVIDIGSGSTKVLMAEVDTETNAILTTLFADSFAVPYQASLELSSDGSFGHDVKTRGIEVFEKIKEIANSHQIEKIVAVATSAFRKSNNAREYVREVRERTQIDIQIIPQREEGEIAFFSALAAGGGNRDDLVVWDIGTGSLQMTVANENGSLVVYMGEQMGSVAFKSYIIDVIQDKELDDDSSPNPVSEEDLKAADSYVRAFARKAYPLIKEKIGRSGTVVGIGRLFYHSIRPLAAEDGVITRKGLRTYIVNALYKSDDELNNPFAHVDVSNCILALAIMKALHIHEIIPVEATSTQGLLISPYYWE